MEVLAEREEMEGLRQAIAYYQASPGPVIPHRRFGPLTRAEWIASSSSTAPTISASRSPVERRINGRSARAPR